MRYVAYSSINSDKPILVGPWKIVPNGNRWMIYLQPPTLQTIRWKKIEADLGGRRFNDLSVKASSSTENGLVWNNQLPGEVKIEVDPSWQRLTAQLLSGPAWSTAGVACWWMGASIVLTLAALRTRRPEPATGHATQREHSDAQPSAVRSANVGAESAITLVQTLLQWALLSAVIALILVLLHARQSLSPRWYALLCIPAGLALVLIARPWSRGTSPPVRDPSSEEPPYTEGVQRRQARAVVWTTCAVGAIGLSVVLAHDVFGLPENLQPKTTTASGRVGLVMLGLATLWLWLAAMAAWAWRFAQEGGLLRGRGTTQWDKVPARSVAVVGSLLAAVAGALLGCAWLVGSRQWERLAWIAEQRDPAAYNSYLDKVLANFFVTYITWLFAYSWVLTGIALLALLHFRNKPRRVHGRRRPARFPLGPSKPDIMLIITIFSFFVGLRAARFANLTVLYLIWLVATILSLYAVLALGRRWSVLRRLGEPFCGQRLGIEKNRRELMEKAHEYRSLNHQMYLLNQGRAGAATYKELEDGLRRLRQWLVAGCGRKEPPEQISVLDVALAWGPEGNWWHNAVRAARLAFIFGIPATVGLVYYQVHDPFALDQILYGPTGLPDMVADVILYQLAWAAAGFTLGALWRLLPGRRSQMRAWVVTAAYGVPVLPGVLLIHLTDTNPGKLTLYTVLLLSVLTLTSIWMDIATFRGELQYWPNRFSLLLSIYQMRGLSVQITWILAQAGAAAALLHELTR